MHLRSKSRRAIFDEIGKEIRPPACVAAVPEDEKWPCRCRAGFARSSWRLRALLLHSLDRLREPGEGVCVGRHTAFARGRLNNELRALLQRLYEAWLIGLVFDPGIVAFGDERKPRAANFDMGGVFLDREAHDDRDLLPDVLARAAGDKDIGGIAV